MLQGSADTQGHSKRGRSTGSLNMSHPNLTNCSPFPFQLRGWGGGHGLVDDYHVCVNTPFKFLKQLTDFYVILYEYYGDGGHAPLLVVTTWRSYELWGESNSSVTSQWAQNDVGLCQTPKLCSHVEDNRCRWNNNMETARNFIWLSVLRPTTGGSLKLRIWNSIWKQGCRMLTHMCWWRTVLVLVTTWLSNCIIHKEECGRSIPHNASNLPYIASYYRTSFTVSIFYPALFEANHLTDNVLVEARRLIERIP